MGSIAISLAGAGIGFLLGGPTGAQIGWLIGSLAANLLDPPKVYGPRLNDLKVRGADYGHMRPILYGMVRIGGLGAGQGSMVNGPNMFTEHEEKSGGKGGPEQINYTYALSFFNEICEGEIIGVWRRWANGRLITEGGELPSPKWPYTLYVGSATQLPDPTMETIYGVGEVTPMRGVAYESVEELPLQDYGNARPNVEYEAYTAEGVFPWRVSHFDPTQGVANEHRVTAFANGRVIVGNYRGASLPNGHYYENTFELDGTLVSSYDAELVGGTGFGIYPIQGITGAGDGLFGTGWFYKENFAGAITGNVYGITGQTRVYYDDYIFSTGADFPKIGISRWPATNGVISAETLTPDAELYTGFDIGGGPGYSLSGFVLGSTNNHAVYLFNGADNILYEYDFDLSGIVRQWDLSAEDAIQNIVNGAGFTVYRNIRDDLIFCCDRGNTGGKNAGAFYLNDDLTVTFVGKVDAIDGFIATVAELGSGGYALVDDGVISLIPPPAAVILGDIVADIMRRCGYTPSQYDVSDLTQSVRGFVIGSQMTGFNAIDTLRKGYFFDAGDAGNKVVFKNRGHDAIETIPDRDLCAHVPGSVKPEPLKLTRVSEQELPRTVFINYYDFDHDYQQGSQYWRRQVTGSQSDTTLDLPLSLTGGEAQQIAQWHMHFAWLERDHFEFYTYKKWEKLIPTDVVVVRGVNIRITKKTVSPGHIIKFEGVRAFAGGFVDADGGDTVSDPIGGGIPGGTPGGQPPQNPPSASVPTDLVLLDIPILSQNHAPFGFYAAMGPAIDGRWPGAALYKSLDAGVTYNVVATAFAPAIIGHAMGALDDYTGGAALDTASGPITIRLNDDDATLSSCTSTALDNGANLCALRSGSGWEILQFQNATLTGVKTYQIDQPYYRGLKGTSGFNAGHAIGDAFVLLSTVVNVDAPESELNVSLKYKAVTFGTAIADAIAQDFTNTGESPGGSAGGGGGGSPGNGFFDDIANNFPIWHNGQTGTSYVLASTDRAAIVTFDNASPVAVTLPDTLPKKWWTFVENVGAGDVTLTPGGSATIDGAASLVLATDQGIFLEFDGVDYWTMRGMGGGGTGGSTIQTEDEGSLIDADATTLNFVGDGVSATDAGSGVTQVTIYKALAVLTTSYAASLTVDLSSYQMYSHVRVDVGVLSGNITLDITNGANGQIIRVRLKQDGTGGRTLAFGGSVATSSDVPLPVLSTTPSAKDFLGFEWDGNDSKARLMAIVRGF